jgi:hypothetical protein
VFVVDYVDLADDDVVADDDDVPDGADGDEGDETEVEAEDDEE